MIIKTHSNTLVAYGYIWQGDGEYFQSRLNSLEELYGDIIVRMSTGGGDVFAGNKIYNSLNKSSTNIHLVVDGLAASMGSIIMLALPREQVSMVENGYCMIHAPSGGEYGNAKDLESTAKLLRLVEGNFIKKLKNRTGKTEKEVKKLMDGSDHWFSASECKEMGLIGNVIDAEIETPLPIDNPQDMQPQQVYNLYACLYTKDIETFKNHIKTNIKNNMKQPLISDLGLSGVTAQSSDTAIVDAVKTKIDALKSERDTAVNALKDQSKKQVKAFLDANKGVFDEDKRAVYEDIGEKSGIEALSTILQAGAKKAGLDLNSLINDKDKNKESELRADWDFDKWQTEDPKGLEKKSVEDPAWFNNLYNAKYNK